MSWFWFPSVYFKVRQKVVKLDFVCSINRNRDILSQNSHKFPIIISSRNIFSFAVKSFMMIAIVLFYVFTNFHYFSLSISWDLWQLFFGIYQDKRSLYLSFRYSLSLGKIYKTLIQQSCKISLLFADFL